MKSKMIVVSRIEHRGEQVLLLKFDYDNELQELIRNFPGAKYTQTHKGWTVPNNKEALNNLITHFKNKAWLNYTDLLDKIGKTPANDAEQKKKFNNQKGKKSKEPLDPEIEKAINDFCDHMRIRRYSDASIKSYRDALRPFFRYFKGKGPMQITTKDVEEYNLREIVEKELSIAYQRHFTGAVKLFFEHARNWKVDMSKVQRTRGGRYLPEVLSKEEMRRLLDAKENIKHKCILQCIYSGGLRLGELLKLKLHHLDFDRKIIRIEGAKGRKDRVVGLSDMLAVSLKEYFKMYEPKDFVFEGRSGKKYSAKSVQQVFQDAVKKAGIKKNVSVHSLRHSYGTHLLEAGTNLRYIQALLGHASPKTTTLYTHIAKGAVTGIRSPLDDL